jgi:carotenoid cleavage dioxygenase-like enzyme
VIGDIPRDLNGVYLRNGHNQVHAPIGKYHPFDGDGMIHGMHFGGGKATYRNRFVRTTGFLAEARPPANRCGPASSSRAGRAPRLGLDRRDEGQRRHRRQGACRARAGCDEPVQRTLPARPGHLETLGPDPPGLAPLGERGICSHFQVDPRTGEMMFFNFGEHPPVLQLRRGGAPTTSWCTTSRSTCPMPPGRTTWA